MGKLWILCLGCLAMACSTAPTPGSGPGPSWRPPVPPRLALYSDTDTAAPGSVELESGVAYDPGDSFDLPLAAKLGLGEVTEGFVTLVSWRRVSGPGADGEGFGDVGIGVRHRFFDRSQGEGRSRTAALELTGKLPTADDAEGLGSGEPDGSLALIGVQDAGRTRWIGSYTATAAGNPDGGSDAEHALSVAFAYGLAGGVSVFAEHAWTYAPEAEASDHATLAGLSFELDDATALDLGVVLEEGGEFRLVAGLTRLLGM